jgi:hypothetical protein
VSYPFLLKKLFVKSNELEKQPNYRCEILQHFRSLRVIDELELPADALPTLLYLQEFIGDNIVSWIGSLVELNTGLQHQAQDKQIKPYKLQRLVTLLRRLTGFFY